MSSTQISSTSHQFTVFDTTASSSSGTGCLILYGGAGIAGNLNVSGSNSIITNLSVNNFYIGAGTPNFNGGANVGLIQNTIEPTVGNSSGVYYYNIGDRFVTKNNKFNIHDTTDFTVRVKTVGPLPGGSLTYNNSLKTLTGTTALSTIDGLSVNVNDYVFVDQSCTNIDTTAHCGIYIISSVANPFVLTRAVFANSSAHLSKGARIVVQEGSSAGGTYYIHTTLSYTATAITWDTTPLTFAQVFMTGTSHSSLSNLSADDHAQYLNINGRASGQTVYGGTGSGETLLLYGTTNGTNGTVRVGGTSNSTSTNTGSFTVAGGVGVAGDIYGTDIHATNSIYLANNIYGTTTNGDISVIPNGTGRLLLNGDPTLPYHAVTKQYVDSLSAGIAPKVACKYKTTLANLNSYATTGVTYNSLAKTLTSNTNGAFVVDSATPSVGDRILYAHSTDSTPSGQNVNYGIYDVTTVGNGGAPWVLTRSSDADNTPNSEYVSGIYTFVFSGTSNINTSWVLTTANPITLGVTAQTWAQFSGGIPSDLVINSLTTNNITIAVTSSNTISTTSGGLTISPVNGNIIMSTASNGNITLSPDGTGKILISNTLDTQGNIITSSSNMIITATNSIILNPTDVVAGGTSASQDLYLQSTTNATRGYVRLIDNVTIGIAKATSAPSNGMTGAIFANSASPTSDPNTNQMYLFNKNGILTYRSTTGSDIPIYPSISGNDVTNKFTVALSSELSSVTNFYAKKNGKIVEISMRITTVAGITSGTILTQSDSDYTPDATIYVANDTDIAAPQNDCFVTCYNSAGTQVDTATIRFTRAGNSGTWTGISYTGGSNNGGTSYVVIRMRFQTAAELYNNVALNTDTNYYLSYGVTDITNLFTPNTTYINATGFKVSLVGNEIILTGLRNGTTIPANTALFTITNNYAYGSSAIYTTGSIVGCASTGTNINCGSCCT